MLIPAVSNGDTFKLVLDLVFICYLLVGVRILRARYFGQVYVLQVVVRCSLHICVCIYIYI